MRLLLLGALGGSMVLMAPVGAGLAGGVAPGSAAQAGATTATGGTGGPDMAEVITRSSEDWSDFERFYNIRWSEELLAAREAFLARRLAALRSIDFAGLEQDARVDYVLLRNQIREESGRVGLARRQLDDMSELLGVRKVIVPLEQARWRMEKLDPRRAAEELTKIPEMIRVVRERVERGRKPAPEGGEGAGGGGEGGALAVSAVTANRAAGAMGSLLDTLRTWRGNYETFEPSFRWWCERPLEDATRAIEEFARFLREEIAGVNGKPEDPLLGDPIGREALLVDLRDNALAYAPEELIALAEREFVWCEGEMLAAAKELGSEDWKAALETVKRAGVEPGEQDEYVRAVAREAIDFVKSRDLVTVPPLCEEVWRLTMLSTQAQRTLPFAVYFGQAMGVAYATSEMAHADKLMAMKGNNRHFTRIVVPHELIPGHHLQRFLADRERPYRRRFSTPFYVEGWALYWEMKLWDLGWAQGPADRIGMLFWRMHRCARIIVSLKFHLGEMKPAEMIDFLVERVGHERANATAEVRRFIGGDYEPLYQCGYMIGGLQLRALHREAIAAGMGEKDFNDRVLRSGPIPIELVRAGVVGAPLSAEGEAMWKITVSP